MKHALIGNRQVLALISPEAAIEWLCMPRFDSPSVFAALLDDDLGGVWAFDTEVGARWSSTYVEDTNVVRTVVETAAGTWAVEDFCPLDSLGGAPSEVIRIVRRLSGKPRVSMRFEARLDYGRSEVVAAVVGGEVRVGEHLRLTTNAPLGGLLEGLALDLAEPLVFVLSWGVPTTQATLGACQRALSTTIEGWRHWLHETVGRVPESARRSALCLKLHTFGPTGAIIAATTTSIPEAIGTPRTWDYRYAWIRDGAFAAEALLKLGDVEAARAFFEFLERAVGDKTPQPLYRIDADPSIPEEILDHLRGYENTKPVRIGNAAAEQTQHDTWGQIIWLADRLRQEAGSLPDDARFEWLASLVEGAERARHVPDAGIWEFRDRPGRYTFSRLWCWVALDRGAALAEAVGDTERAAKWRALADEERGVVLDAADRAGFFAQTLDGTDVDASSLFVAVLGLVDFDDPRFLATIERCEADLAAGGFMQRYIVEDDFGDTTSTFSLCTLWWIEALACSGQPERAGEILGRFMACANPVGLFSEDIEPDTKALLGNFPQVYSHTGLINVALALSKAPTTR